MHFLKFVLLEGTLCLLAGMVFMAGIKGILLTVGALTVLNGICAFMGGPIDFWRYELVLCLGGIIGGLVLSFCNTKAKAHHMVMGITGGLISLVLFGAFFSPLTALLIWAMVIGLGLIPQQKRAAILWGVAPTVWRCLLGLGIVVLGNYLIQ